MLELYNLYSSTNMATPLSRQGASSFLLLWFSSCFRWMEGLENGLSPSRRHDRSIALRWISQGGRCAALDGSRLLSDFSRLFAELPRLNEIDYKRRKSVNLIGGIFPAVLITLAELGSGGF